MKSKSKIALMTAATMMLMGVAVADANANYTGLANGDPGPADIWAASHPSFGKVTHHWTHRGHMRDHNS